MEYMVLDTMRQILYMLSFKGALMKKVFKRIISILLLFLITIGILSYTQVRFDHNNIRVEGFYCEQKDSIDVVFIGASEVYSDYSPVYAYERYGYTSYNYSIEDNPLELYKWELDEVFAHQDPKLVVIELTAATSDRDLSQKVETFDATLRKISDSVPLSSSKYSLVNEFGKKNHLESYYYPPIMYHGAIPKRDLAKEIIGFHNRGYSYLKGAVTHTNSRKCSKEDLINIDGDDTKQTISQNQEEKLVDLLNYCKIKKYNVLFTRFPHRVESKEKYLRYCEGNYIADIVKNNGFDYLECENVLEGIGIDRIEDFADGEHLRADGSKLFTEYIGNILRTQYGISKTELTENCKKRWDNCIKYIDGFYNFYDSVKNQNEDKFLYENNNLIKTIESSQ